MSQQYSSVLKMGASAPFHLVMALSRFERMAFAQTISPNLLPALKSALVKGA